MRIVISTVKIPFVRGGAELLAESLLQALIEAGHQAEIVQVPFKWYPPEQILDQMLSCRLLDLSQSSGTPIDLLIGLKFPAYYIAHSNKVLWILHQHRQAYDLWDHPLAGDLKHFPNGRAVQQAIIAADTKLIPEAKAVYTISKNVSNRLERYCAIPSTPLYHPPPHANVFHPGAYDDYLFFPSRLNPIKRQNLVIDALAQTRSSVRIVFGGAPDTPSYFRDLQDHARRLGVDNRITWMGEMVEEEKLAKYVNCLAVVYPPVDEDYGYVTLEAMLSAKAVITCTDSGGTREFVVSRQTGYIVDPDPTAMALAFDELWHNRPAARDMGQAARDHYSSLGICWDSVLRSLVREA